VLSLATARITSSLITLEIFHLDVIGWSGLTDCLMQRSTTPFEDSKYKLINYAYIV
jgi:hypothetical protein